MTWGGIISGGGGVAEAVEDAAYVDAGYGAAIVDLAD